NSTPTLIQGLRANITIKSKDTNKTIVKKEKEQLSFAPNSNFKLVSEWGEQFKAGEYIYILHLEDKENHKWDFTKEFTIKEKDSNKLNSSSVDKTTSSLSLYLLGGFGILVLIGLLSCFFYKLGRDVK
ncbi:WxL protein host-binding domain-containing protein, partial [Enterococcus faecalis]|uniref:WxL protein host-binding domain-containing protein n=1 Tax=Enterococcus faecalis TaxID=1351 RepID=UPI003D12D768